MYTVESRVVTDFLMFLRKRVANVIFSRRARRAPAAARGRPRSPELAKSILIRVVSKQKNTKTLYKNGRY